MGLGFELLAMLVDIDFLITEVQSLSSSLEKYNANMLHQRDDSDNWMILKGE